MIARDNVNGKLIKAILGIALPVLVLLIACISFSDNIPYMDSWELVPLWDKFYSNQLSFVDLWAQHNEHRLLFPRLIMLGLGYISQWNYLYEIAVNIILGVSIYGVIAYRLYSIDGFKVREYVWLYTSISILAFSLIQQENWLWGWQMQIFLNIFAVVGGCFIVSRENFSWIAFSGACIAAIVATYSFANGMLLWIIAGVLLISMLYQSYLRRSKIAAIIFMWIIIAGSVITSYLYLYTKPGQHPDLSYALYKLHMFVLFILAYIGSPIAVRAVPAVIVGLGGIVIFVILAKTSLGRVWKKQISPAQIYPWLGLASYSVLSAGITAIGRAGFGLNQAVVSRYSTIANLFWISLIVLYFYSKRYGFEQEDSLIYKWYRAIMHRKRLIGIVLVITFLWGSGINLKNMWNHHKSLSEAKVQIISGNFEERYLSRVYPIYNIAKVRVSILQKYHLSLFDKP